MFNLRKIVFVSLCAICVGYGAGAAELSGTASVNVTSETASDAKNIALGQARRQVINQVLGKYANASLVQVAVKNSKPADLMNMISSSSIDGEKQSDTTYAANITMFIDADAARAWLDANHIQNWLPDSSMAATGMGTHILVTMSDRVGNWMDLKRLMRDSGIDMKTVYIMGNQATIEVPAGKTSVFINALRGHGWGYTTQNGVIKVWK